MLTAVSTIVRFHIDEGTTVMRAVFIRNDGVQSEEADGTYKVVFEYSG